MGIHAKLAPSSSGRWMNCPGCVRLEEKFPDVESPYAAEGTAAHGLAETCLKSWSIAFDYMGQTIEGFEVDEEMALAVQLYLDEIRGLVSQRDLKYRRAKFMVEEKFHLDWIHKDIFGTSDCAVYIVEEKKLYVFDYKHGKGVVVDPEQNSQLMIYALGAMYALWQTQTETTKKVMDFNALFNTVELVIVQPRAPGDSVKRWQIESDKLIAWGITSLKAAALETENENAKLKAGSHCRFCKAIAVCPEQARHACEVAKVDFDKPLLPPPEELTPEHIAKVLEVSKSFNNWAGEVKAYAQRQLEAGVQIPGYKLVPRRANRRWRKDSGIEDQLFSLIGEDAFTKKVLSVAQAERKCKAFNIDKAILTDYWEKPDTGITIAEASDKRKPVISSVQEDFLDFLQ